MISNQERDRFIAEQLNQGVSLSDVQKALSEQFGIRMTYLDLRMLAAGLQVDWQKQDKQVPKQAAPPSATTTEAEGSELPVGAEDAPAEDDGVEDDAMADEGENDVSDGTTVTVSKLVRPGTSLSGDVTFASGAHGEWYIDNMGRLGLALAEGSSKPDENDIRSFQIELRKALGY